MEIAHGYNDFWSAEGSSGATHKDRAGRYGTEPDDGRILAELVECVELRRIRSDHVVGSRHRNRYRHGEGVCPGGELSSLSGRSWLWRGIPTNRPRLASAIATRLAMAED